MCVVVVVVMGLMIIDALLGLFCELVVNSMSLEVLNKRRVEEGGHKFIKRTFEH